MDELDGIKVKSLYKALKILEFFDRNHRERGISEIVKESGMLKSTVYNVIATFAKCGYLEKNNETGKYKLGLKILELSNVLQNNDETKTLKPFMDRIAEQCNETVYFAVPSHTEAIYLDAAHPKGVTFTRSIVGVKVKMYCTGVGKAMLAYLGQDLLDRVTAQPLAPFTPYTITDPAALADELEATRQRGYSIDNMEHEYGIRCVGVPIRNLNGAVIGALSVSGPSLRIMDDKVEEFARYLTQAAAEVQSLLR